MIRAASRARLSLPIPVVPLELPAYQKKENWGAAETFYQLVRTWRRPTPPPGFKRAARAPDARPRCNILGPTALGFRHRDDVREVTNCSAARHRHQRDRAARGDARAISRGSAKPISTCVLYPEIALQAAQWLEPHLRSAAASRPFRSASARRANSSPRWRTLAGVDPPPALRATPRTAAGTSRSVDSTYLTGKRVFVFGDATHAIAAARIAAEELGFTVVGLGTYSREFAREVREAAAKLRRRGADHRRLSASRSAGRRAAAGTGAGHADGAPYRQAARAFPAR